MKRRAGFAAVCLATLVAAGGYGRVAADEKELAGFSAQTSTSERHWEEQFRSIPDPGRMRSYME
jgi:hypothetical protein